MGRPLKRVLLVNDDGIDAAGLTCLEAVAEQLADEVWVVAPEVDQSGSSHSVTLHEPLRFRQLGKRRFAVRGTPSDCVIMASQYLMADMRPDLVLSGINRGDNIADSVAYSGTIGAAMTALVMGLPAMALSQAYTDGQPVTWQTALRHGPGVIAALLDMPEREHVCFSINFPDVNPQAVTGVRVASQGRGSIVGVSVEERLDTRGKTYFWIQLHHDRQPARARGNDVDILHRGAVAVCPLRLERDDGNLEDALRERLAPLNRTD